MCGIAGAQGNLSAASLNTMLQKLSHRGPDHLSSISVNNTHLAHARLSIIDLSALSNQPLWDIQKRACIVFNGEIYNYQLLRDELIALGYQFVSHGDAEVIINLYLHYGIAGLQKLNGMFAFALWDVFKEELLVVRDQFGVKPLYYTENSEGFYFASELKALLHVPGINQELNYDAILRTIVFLWSPGSETILKNIKKLEPGSYLIVKNNQIIHKNIFSEWPEYQPKKTSVKQLQNELQDALSQSIRSQLVSDVPVGAFLSGGLDSSLIVAMAQETQKTPLECFTIDSVHEEGANDGFEDDLPYAQKVASLLGANLNIIQAKSDICKLLPKMIYHLDEPQADPAPLNVLLICDRARQKGFKVLFSGAGGDDIFSGYRRHFAIKIDRYLFLLPKYLRKKIQKIGTSVFTQGLRLRRFSKFVTHMHCDSDERLLSYFYWMDPKIVFELFTDEIQAQLSTEPMAALLSDLKKRSGLPALEKMLYLERRYFLVDHNFNYTDKMSMAHGVEVRVPFLDPRVTEVASKIDQKYKCRGKECKWILKKMAERYLPKSIIYRPKTGFGAPLRTWLNGDLVAWVDSLLSEENILKRGLFKPEKVLQLLKDDRSGKADYSYSIFALICLELWFRIFLDGELLND